MKIVFRLSDLAYGGTERVFLSVADYLSRAHGWQVMFVVDQIRGHATEKVARDKGYAVVGLGASRTWRSIWPFFRFLNREKPSVVISAYTETNGAALLSNAMQFFRTPVIVSEHAALDEHWGQRSHGKKRQLEIIVRQLYKLSNRVVCVSQGMLQGLKRRLPKKQIDVVYNPVRFNPISKNKESARDELGINPASSVLIAVGRISKQKNYSMLLRSLVLLKSNDVELYIIGGVSEVDEKSFLEKMVVDLDLSDRVHFIDYTNEIQKYYEAADLLVMSSAWEGFGNVLVEALNFGLPIVSTRCNYGPAEILGNGRYGVLVDVDDVSSMAQAIERLLQSSSFDPADLIGRAQDFTEEKIGKAYHDLILEISGARRWSVC